MKNQDVANVEADEELDLILKKIDSTASDFKGFLVQARYVDGDKALVGEFEFEHDGGGKHVACGAGGKNTITHKNGDAKSEVLFSWEHPEFYDGPDKKVEIMFSVVQNYSKTGRATCGGRGLWERADLRGDACLT